MGSRTMSYLKSHTAARMALIRSSPHYKKSHQPLLQTIGGFPIKLANLVIYPMIMACF
ncbi:hypothetical protein J7E55_18180 [Bacillus sp. ISL-53]|nr:hypothetical protein [Bacillus sp. ISL-53]